MKTHLPKNFRQGSTSIYVVVITTLLFSVITVSFIRIVVGELSKTTSDELAQAAYDSALAGVEDAKAALLKYYKCLEGDDSMASECPEVISSINSGFAASDSESSENYYCDAVSEALGRIDKGANTEVLINESINSDLENTVQAYTCVMIDKSLADYRATFSASESSKIVPLKVNPSVINQVTGIRIAWYEESDGPFNEMTINGSVYNPDYFYSHQATSVTPPVLSAQIIQTATTYNLEQLKNPVDGRTDRGTIFLVPALYNPSDSSIKNHLTSDIYLASNDHTSANVPQKIGCSKNNAHGLSEEFACVTTIAITEPVGGNRNPDTFFLVLSLPYGQPKTSFSVQVCTDDDTAPGRPGDCVKNGQPSIANLEDVQIAVDSTGRANNMYSRVETRLEFVDTLYPFAEFAVEASGEDEDAISKNFMVTSNCLYSEDGVVKTCSNVTER